MVSNILNLNPNWRCVLCFYIDTRRQLGCVWYIRCFKVPPIIIPHVPSTNDPSIAITGPYPQISLLIQVRALRSVDSGCLQNKIVCGKRQRKPKASCSGLKPRIITKRPASPFYFAAFLRNFAHSLTARASSNRTCACVATFLFSNRQRL